MSAQSTYPAIIALVVGINRYSNSVVIPPLNGCLNDADAVSEFLLQRFDAPPHAICVLRNAEATHQAIIDRFRDHLIAAARAWHDASKPDPAPAFLFHFSGHGAQATDPTGTKPNGLDETIVPYDSRTPGVFDIKDWELGQLLDELTRYTDNVTVVLDCCHSGSGTRDPEPTLVAARRCPNDTRPQPGSRPVTPASTRNLAGGSGWARPERYVLLAACQDRELANEYCVRQGSNLLDHGALTYFLLRELGKPAGGRPWTYRELHERVLSAVKRTYPAQTPQCEGDRDREIFGGLRPRRDPFLNVIRIDRGYVWVDGGVAHQLTEGSLLHVHPPETRTLADAGPTLTTLEVEEVRAVESGCRVIEEQATPALHSRVIVYRLNAGDFRRSVVLEGSGPAVAALQNLLAHEDNSFVEITSGSAPADFRVSLRADQFEVQDGSGRLLIAPIPAAVPDRVVADLCHLVRYRNALQLQNNAAHSELLAAVELRVRRLEFASEPQAPVAVPISPTAGGEIQVEVGQPIVLEVANHSLVPLYLGVLDFSYDWSVSLLHPRQGEQQALNPGQSLRLGLSRLRREQIIGWLPDDIAEVQQVVKVIASVQPANYETLCQGPLDLPLNQRQRSGSRPGTPSALDRLLELASRGGRHRGALVPPPATTAHEWTTAQIEFTLVRRLDEASVSRALVGGRATTFPGYPLHIEAPAGFTGTVRILTARQATRAAPGDAAGSDVPPGLAPFPEYFQPLRLLPTRAVCPSGAEIEIEADAEARALITDRTPLTIEQPVGLAQDSAGVLAVAGDGNLFYPVGGARPGEAVAVRWLPAPGGDERPRLTQRALGRTIKLYLFKLLGLPTPSLGLHRARFIPEEQLPQDPATAGERVHRVPAGEVRCRPVDRGECRPGQRVALIVHGFQSDTYWMVAQLQRVFAQAGATYDHVLTFDYESFNTRVRDNAQTLATALRTAGFGPDDGVHLDVFAHSMGGVVTRYLTDVFGGAAYIDRCFLAGTPNQGTIVARAKQLLPWLGTLLLNTALGPIPTLLGAWALQRIGSDAVGMEDLCPGSACLRELNALADTPCVPFYLLVGDYQVPDAARGLWQRLWQKFNQGLDAALDFAFDDANDQVVSATSIRTLRDGRYPAELLSREVVPCSHSEYFASPAAEQHLVRWLRQSRD